MAHSCVSSSLNITSSSLSIYSPNPSSSHSSSSKKFSLPLQTPRSRHEISRKSNKSNFKCSSVRAVHAPDFSAPERSSRSGIWSIRDGLQIPSSPYFPVNARGPRGPSPMVQERFMSVISQLLKYRIIRCGGEVNDDMANTIVAQLLCLDAADPTKDIVMYINSPGGSVTAGYAIFDTMRHIRPDISTVCVGLAASMGAFLLGAGAKGKRYSLPNSRIMIHQPLGGAQGSSTDIDVQADEMMYHKANLTGYLAQFTGHSLMKLYDDTNYDYFMSAKEAKEYGLIDGIILNPLKALQPLAAAGHNSNNDSSDHNSYDLVILYAKGFSFVEIKFHGELGSDAVANLGVKLTQLKRQIHSERVVSVGEKLEKNRKKAEAYISHLKELAASRADCALPGSNSNSGNFLSLGMNDPLCKVQGRMQGHVDRDDADSEEVLFPMTARLPLVERIPPYTTWIFLDRNQRMADDQSVVGRRRIYYDPHGSEALICSDSEEEIVQVEKEKYDFSEGEDRVMRVAVQECGVANEVFDMLTQFVGGTSQEIKDHCNMLMENDPPIEKMTSESSRETGFVDSLLLEKSLAAALDSFDNIFCRRCLVFDCHLHGCFQDVINPNEKQPFTFDHDDDRKPCGDQCYLQMHAVKNLPKNSRVDSLNEHKTSEEKAHFPESKGRSSILQPTDSLAAPTELVLEEFQSSSNKKLELNDTNLLDNSTSLERQFSGKSGPIVYELERDDVQDKGKDITELPLKQASNSIERSVKVMHRWKPFEKDLYLKGLEIFGRNSCYIARNLLAGLKTCKEVSTYMYGDGAVMSRGSSAMCFEDVWKADMDHMIYEELNFPVKSRMCRKRGRVRKVKSSWKSAGHPSLWKRTADGKDLPCAQRAVRIGSEDATVLKAIAKAGNALVLQLAVNVILMFVEIVGCGDGSLGEPPRRGDSQCSNMKLLLRQQQRILLAKSDVAGWGAFLKNTVNKNEYLGEYTGELISHREADKRGKIYDRANSSFLFDLNDKAKDILKIFSGWFQYVLDACRKGDKLKFANHSSTPNCYAKVMLVAGDHRVGIYANERIEAGEELFYDYRYGPDQAPSWARKPEGPKRDDISFSQGRAKKHQSG
ncbi:ATP-dependent Clp protease proteolytic subunit [Striga asiatica]|uniref:Endopeptidase Clp n=1 Tax=Striga asiatica TaxID=4170 RepID=A0A5A7QG90_STRAF|nr:ATP-dependent Clp protease proteolytic subunit [Striga asiatica]